MTEAEVVDRYLGYWEARFEANTGTPDPTYEGLAEFATGAQLDAVVAETTKNLTDGLAFRVRRKPANFQRVEVVALSASSAEVQECVVDDALVVRRATGEVVNDAVATHNVRGHLVRVDGRWRVDRVELVQRWEGVAGCAVAS